MRIFTAQYHFWRQQEASNYSHFFFSALLYLRTAHYVSAMRIRRRLFGYALSLSSPAMGNDSSDGVTDKGEEGRKEGRNRRRRLSIGSGHTGNSSSSSSSSMSGCGAASAALVVLNNQRRGEEIGVFSPLLVGVVLVVAPSCTTRQAQAVDLTLTLAAVVASKGEKVVSRIQGERGESSIVRRRK